MSTRRTNRSLAVRRRWNWATGPGCPPPNVTPAATPVRMAASPDGKSVVTERNNRVAQYNVGPTGKLSPRARHPSPPRSFRLGLRYPERASVYVTFDDPSNGIGGVSQFDVGTNGRLSPKSPASVANSDLGSWGVAVSPSGNNVYVLTSGRERLPVQRRPGRHADAEEPSIRRRWQRPAISCGAAEQPKRLRDERGQPQRLSIHRRPGRQAPAEEPAVCDRRARVDRRSGRCGGHPDRRQRLCGQRQWLHLAVHDRRGRKAGAQDAGAGGRRAEPNRWR